ncbi:MAG: GNAT family N-acetyltransferase [Candidatus Ozemobacteraceae bacterium]
MEIVAAGKEHAEGIAEIFRLAYNGRYPDADFTDPELIGRNIISGNRIFRVALEKGRVIGTMSGSLNPWNMSYEGGRLVVHPEFRGKNLGITMHGLIREQATSMGYDMVYYTVRDRIGIKAVEERLEFTLCGYLPGKHRLYHRENHPFYLSASAGFDDRRPGCAANPIYETRLVRDILKQLTLMRKTVPYPTETLVGPPGGTTLTLQSGSLRYHCQETEDFVEILGVEGDPSVLLSELIQGSKSAIPEVLQRACYFELDLMADKTEIMEKLGELGFSPFVFLPGWHLKEGKRYDCVRLVLREPYGADPIIRSAVRRVEEGLGRRS